MANPSLDRKMMFLLRKLADKGHTIILVTHATNNLSACDYVCFLAPGGRLAHFGPTCPIGFSLKLKDIRR